MWLALVLALLGSLNHVAWAFASLEGGNLAWGYVQAVAVDIGLFALAYSIQQRRRERRSAWLLWIGVAVFSAISAYANLLHGLFFAADLQLGTWQIVRPFALAGVLPLLVLYLSEVCSEDRQFAARLDERQQKREERQQQEQQAETDPRAAEIVRAFASIRTTPSRYAEQAEAILAVQPNTGPRALSRQLGCSVSTASRLWHEHGNGARHRQEVVP